MATVTQSFLQLQSRSTTPLAIRRALSSCPFQTLGLKSSHNHHHSSRAPLKSATITYAQVRDAFRKLALIHHPDTADKSDRGHSSREFTRIKDAFDKIVEGPGGLAVLRDHSYESESADEASSPSNAGSNEHQSNNTMHSSLNPSILREVANVADTMSPGGLDRGGMWQYANMVRNMAQQGNLPPLQMEGSVEEEKNRRRRRKK